MSYVSQGQPTVVQFSGSNITLSCKSTKTQGDLANNIYWYKNHQMLQISGKMTYASPNNPTNHSIVISNITKSNSGNYLGIKLSVEGQGLLVIGQKVTIENKVTRNQFPSFIPNIFPESNFEPCNFTGNDSQIWCTTDYRKGSLLVSSVPVTNEHLTFHKNWNLWKLALSYSNEPVISCVAPPYALLIGSINLTNSSNGGYDISCTNCVFNSCIFPSAETQSILILKQPMYVMVPVHVNEPWYQNTGVQAWVGLSTASQRRRRFTGWLIVR